MASLWQMVWPPRAQDLLRVCREVQGRFREVEGDGAPIGVFCCTNQIWLPLAKSS